MNDTTYERLAKGGRNHAFLTDDATRTIFDIDSTDFWPTKSYQIVSISLVNAYTRTHNLPFNNFLDK
jgi:hypothetical protein